MGKQNKAIEASIVDNNSRIDRELKNHKHRTKYGSQNYRIPPKIYVYKDYWVRNLNDWKYSGKSKDHGRITENLIRFLFEKYTPPIFLKNEFLLYLSNSDYWDEQPQDLFDIRFPEQSFLWYLCFARGESIYKTYAHKILTKKETHFALKASPKFHFQKALWYGVITQLDGDQKIKSRILESAIMENPISKIMRDFVRLLLTKSIPLSEINNLYDYVDYMEHRRFLYDQPGTIRQEYSLKGRTIDSLQKQQEAWHRDLGRQKELYGISWSPTGFTDNNYTTGKNENKTSWNFSEITTGQELHQEGKKQRHCVTAYKHACMSGRISIVSLKQKAPNYDKYKRSVTIEVQLSQNINHWDILKRDIDIIPNYRRIAQARRFGNKLTTPTERNVIRKWAQANNIKLTEWSFIS